MTKRYGERPMPHASGEKTWWARGIDFKARRVCKTCNSGWLSRLEDAVRKRLSPVIEGTSAVVFDKTAQALVARWAVKTASLLGLVTSPTLEPPTEQLRWLMEHSDPPPQTGMWLAAYGGREASFLQTTVNTAGYRKSNPAETWRNVFSTICFGHMVVLVLQMWGAPEEVVVGTHADVMEKFTVKVWPMREVARWPPALGCDEDGIQKLSKAMSNGLIQVFAKVDRIQITDESSAGGFYRFEGS